MLLFAVGAAVLALVAAVLLAWNARLPSSIQVAAWAAQHGLERDGQAPTGGPDWDHVRRQLRRARLTRTLGFLVAFVIGESTLLAWQQALPPVPLSVLANPSGWVAGYLVGAIAAGLAAQLFLLSEQAGNAFLHARWLGPASFLLGLVCVILAIGTWNGLGTQGWWPSRRARAGAPPPPTRPSRPPGHPGRGRSAA